MCSYHGFMPYRYRRFHYNGPIDFDEHIIKVWIPEHRSLVPDRWVLDSNIRYAIWEWKSRNDFSVVFTAFEGNRPVKVLVKAEVRRKMQGPIAGIRVYYAHCLGRR